MGLKRKLPYEVRIPTWDSVNKIHWSKCMYSGLIWNDKNFRVTGLH